MARSHLTIKAAFVSCKDDLAAPFLERVQALFPELPLWVVSEFPPPAGKWIPFKPNRSLPENLALIRAAMSGHTIRLSAAVLEPRTPHGQLRWIAFRLAPLRFLAFNENLDHFMLRPRCAPAIARHLFWRVKNFLRWQLKPGGPAYTWAWRLRHPASLHRPAAYRAALAAGWAASLLRRLASPRPDPPATPRPDGISVVIPSRNGKDLLDRLLPGVLRQLEPNAEVIVVDNGSDDGTAAFLLAAYPRVRVDVSPQPLSFAAAVNRGIRAASFSHVCLLNNDMIVEPEFFQSLRSAFEAVPDLFCATAQIFFPEGMRRQETGKAVWWSPQDGRPASDFPLRCLLPLEGEDLSYVLYGSGGCSMYDSARLRRIGAFDELLAPAYVEDLDVGWRGWQRNWPTVYVAKAKVTHFHRSTTSRYFKPDLVQSFVEFNFLRFLARRVTDPLVFRKLWRDAAVRLNLLAISQPWFVGWPQHALAFAWKAVRHFLPPPPNCWPEDLILAIGGGAVASFPGRAPTGKPRVLVASPYLPFPLSHGGAVRIFNLMRASAAEFDQILVAFDDELHPVPAELLAFCAEVILVKRYPTHLLPDHGRPDVVEEYCSLPMRALLLQTVRKWQPAVVQLEFTQMAQYARDCAPTPTILVEHDITFDLQQQLLRAAEDWETRRQCTRWIRFEKEAWREIDAIVTMSEKDRQVVAAEVGQDKTVCLPNGVDLDRFQSTGGSPDPRRILFIGSFAHLPNILALDFFLRECWPLLADLGPTLHIIAGSRPELFLDRYKDSVRLDLSQPGIEVEAFVSDVRPAYERATLVIAPLVASAGTNIKVMEAMAMRKAVVSTPAGINGLPLTPGRDVIVAATGPEMAQAIRSLFEDPSRRQALEAEARRTVERDFDWNAIARRQAAMYTNLRLNRPPSSA
ncbi:MAG: glycosyltransferase [Bryobacterales bacterium]|nr:glycosyltransferase [Bryobacterales bacterium]